MRVVTIISGLFLVLLGMLMLTNRLAWLSQWAPLIDLVSDDPHGWLPWD